MSAGKIDRQQVRIDLNKRLVVTFNRCKSCGICLELCPRKVLGEEQVTKRVILLAPEKCDGCGLCEIVCPDYVFTIQES